MQPAWTNWIYITMNLGKLTIFEAQKFGLNQASNTQSQISHLNLKIWQETQVLRIFIWEHLVSHPGGGGALTYGSDGDVWTQPPK